MLDGSTARIGTPTSHTSVSFATIRHRSIGRRAGGSPRPRRSADRTWSTGRRTTTTPARPDRDPGMSRAAHDDGAGDVGLRHDPIGRRIDRHHDGRRVRRGARLPSRADRSRTRTHGGNLSTVMVATPPRCPDRRASPAATRVTRTGRAGTTDPQGSASDRRRAAAPDGEREVGDGRSGDLLDARWHERGGRGGRGRRRRRRCRLHDDAVAAGAPCRSW